MTIFLDATISSLVATATIGCFLSVVHVASNLLVGKQHNIPLRSVSAGFVTQLLLVYNYKVVIDTDNAGAIEYRLRTILPLTDTLTLSAANPALNTFIGTWMIQKLS